jgi:transcriptional regulator with XRE-family HTH domain
MKNNDIGKHFGIAIKSWRTRRGISQHELARRAHLQRTYISDIERGARNTSLRSIKKLADALKISLWMLFRF